MGVSWSAASTSARSSRSGLPCRLNRGLQGVRASQLARSVRSVVVSPRMVWARKVNSFMIPSTLRLAVLPSRTSCMRDSSWVMNASGTSWAASAWARPSGKRASSVAAGASGMRMGNSVALLTNSATCGLQAQALAYQSPRWSMSVPTPA